MPTQFKRPFKRPAKGLLFIPVILTVAVFQFSALAQQSSPQDVSITSITTLTPDSVAAASSLHPNSINQDLGKIQIPGKNVRVFAPGFERLVQRILSRYYFTMIAPPVSLNPADEELPIDWSNDSRRFWANAWQFDDYQAQRNNENVEGSIQILFDRPRRSCVYELLFRAHNLEGQGFYTYAGEIETQKRSRCKRFLKRSLMRYIPYL